jgi:hypothetical protein
VATILVNGSFSKSTTTDAAGNYTITGLPAGSYKVFFEPSFTDGATYIGEYYNNQQSYAAANAITVAEGGAASGIGTLPRILNAQLARGGRTSGKATVPQLVDRCDNLQSTFVIVTIYDSNRDVVDTTYTNANGDYTTEYLRSGTYKVKFEGTNLGTTYYSGKSSLAEAAPVTVTAQAIQPASTLSWWSRF